MKKIILCVLVTACLCSCNAKKETMVFIALDKTEFKSGYFKLPDIKTVDSLKHSHDSCMGFSFEANVILAQTKDSFFIGSIVNRQSLKVAGALNDLGLNETQMTNEFNVLSNPCYEKRTLHFPLKSILGEAFMVKLPGVDDGVNKEINDAVSFSKDEEMRTGSWLYLDMKNVLKKMMDTIKTAAGLAYRKNLLDTANMVLLAVESITEISFIINAGKDMSERLQNVLKNKPSVQLPDLKVSISLFYISNNKFQINLNGFFPIAGQFMKVKME